MGLCEGGGRDGGLGIGRLPSGEEQGMGAGSSRQAGRTAPSTPRHRQQQSLLFAWEFDVTLVLGFYSFGAFLMSRHRTTRKTYKEVFFKAAEGKRRVCVAVYANSY